QPVGRVLGAGPTLVAASFVPAARLGDEGPAQDVLEEGAGGCGIVGVDQGVHGSDHGRHAIAAAARQTGAAILDDLVRIWCVAAYRRYTRPSLGGLADGVRSMSRPWVERHQLAVFFVL